jgi:hypothetical protein
MTRRKSYSRASYIDDALLAILFLSPGDIGAGEMELPSLPFSNSQWELQLTSPIATSIRVQSSEACAGR